MENVAKAIVIVPGAFFIGFLLASSFTSLELNTQFNNASARHFERPAVEDVGDRLAALSHEESQKLRQQLAELFPSITAVNVHAESIAETNEVIALAAVLRRLTLPEAEMLGQYLDEHHAGVAREFAIYPARRQLAARKKIREIQKRLTSNHPEAGIQHPMGGSRDTFPWLSEATGTTVREVIGLSFAREFYDLGVHPSDVSDEEMRFIVALTGLKRLNLTHSSITDAALKSISRLEMLEHLDLSSTSITDRGLKELAGLPQLSRLNLSQVSIDGSCFEALSYCPRLADLHVASDKVTDRSITGRSIGALNRMQNLKKLTLHMASNKSLVLRDLPRLRELHAVFFRQGMDGVTVHLKNLPRLYSLTLGTGQQTRFDEFSFSNLPRIKKLHIHGTQLQRQQFEQIASLEDLRWLSLTTIPGGWPTNIAEAGSLAKLQRLEKFISSQSVSNSLLPAIGAMKNLQELHLVGRNLNADDCNRQLSRLKKLKKLFVSGIEGGTSPLEFIYELPQLQQVSISNSSFDTLRIKAHPTLRAFGGEHNRFRRLVLENNPMLRHVGQSRLQTKEIMVHDLPSLHWLHFSLIDGNQIEHIELFNLPRLRTLRLVPITPRGSIEEIPYTANYGDDILEMVSQFKRLEHLDMPHSAVTESGLKRLEGLPRLQTIDISGPYVSYDAVQKLRTSQYEKIQREAKARAAERRANGAAQTVGSQPGS